MMRLIIATILSVAAVEIAASGNTVIASLLIGCVYAAAICGRP